MKKKMVSILTAAFCVSALLAGCGFADTEKHLPHQQEQHPLPQTERQPLPWASMQNTRRTATWTMRPAITPDLTWSSPRQSARFTAGSW